jgi:diguanylate cyclase (GGDEF)-like protein
VSEGQSHSPTGGPPRRAPSRPRSRTGGLWRLKSLWQGRNRVWTGITVLLVLAGVLASVLGARAVARSDADHARLAFHLASAEIASTLKLAIQHEEDLVVSASAFVTDNPDASAAAFDKWGESVHAIARYPELQDFGFVTLVGASRMAAFETRIAAHPVRPLGAHAPAPAEDFQVLPPGSRPYYCLAVAGLARSSATVIPKGLDYCAIAPTLITARDSGLTGYAPFSTGASPDLGVETPVYRGGAVPSTVTARRRAFLGWIGELLAPEVLLTQALEGHPNLAVIFRYDSRFSHVAFTGGAAPAGAQSSKIGLLVGREAGLKRADEGWTVQSFGASAAGGIFGDWHALVLLIGGSLLSLVLGLLVLVLATGRRRAVSLVEEKTRELSHQALHDTLTGLPNRALVLDRAGQMLARAARRPDMQAGALFIDIDGFKHVNDSLGHAAGDQLLRVVAERLAGAARAQDTVGRLSGDEFVVLVESRAQDATPDLLAERISGVMREPVELGDGGQSLSVTVSIGVAAGDYDTPDALLRDADLALYAAKAAGKDRYALFDASMYEGVESRQELEAELRAATREGQLFLLFQPIVALPSREVVGVEALIRWRHPSRGVLPAEEFIPLAEDSGLIAPIGHWILDEVCSQASAWALDGLSLGISVAIGADQFARAGFTDDVRQALLGSGLDPASLTLGLSEATLMRDVANTCERLKEIKALGVSVAIDGFGTGCASLPHLLLMPADLAKIDRRFVSALGEGGRSREVLAAILGVGHALSLTLVADGVEKQGQVLALEELGCTLAQGPVLAGPGSAEEIESLLGSRGAGPAVGSRTA